MSSGININAASRGQVTPSLIDFRPLWDAENNLIQWLEQKYPEECEEINGPNRRLDPDKGLRFLLSYPDHGNATFNALIGKAALDPEGCDLVKALIDARKEAGGGSIGR